MTCAYHQINSAEACSERATHRFTWPGQQTSQLCTKHLHKLSLSTLPHLLAIEPIDTRAEAEPFTLDVDHDEIEHIDHKAIERAKRR